MKHCLQDIGYQATNKSSPSETGTYDHPNILIEEGFQALLHGGQSWRSQGTLWVAQSELRVQDENGRQALGAKFSNERAVQRIDSKTRAGDKIKAVCSTNICANIVSEENAATASTTKICKKVLAPRRNVSQYYPPLFSYNFGFR